MQTIAADSIAAAARAVIAAKFPAEREPGLLAPWRLDAAPAELDQCSGEGLSEMIIYEGRDHAARL